MVGFEGSSFGDMELRTEHYEMDAELEEKIWAAFKESWALETIQEVYGREKVELFTRNRPEVLEQIDPEYRGSDAA